MTDETLLPFETPIVFHDAPVNQHAERAEFHFDQYAATFARLIADKSTPTPLTIGIHGAWGSGKTSLLRRIQRMLEATRQLDDPAQAVNLPFGNPHDESPGEIFRRCRTVWFDAWKYNGEDQILAALLRVMQTEMQRDGFWNKFKDKVRDAKESFHWGTAFFDAFTQVTSGGMFKLSLQDYQRESSLMQAAAFFDYFDEAFTELLKNWLAFDVNGSMQPKNAGVLTVFIDDLDRCLPAKVVQTLESLKLFLDKPGCVFVLAADSETIRQAVETHYQNQHITGENAQDYLEKIIQLRFELPPIPEGDLNEFLKAQAKIDPKMLKRWKVLIAAAERNPRRVKNVINDVNLQWSLARNSGQAQYFEQSDFINWHALLHAAPRAFVEQLLNLEHPEQQRRFVQAALHWQTRDKDDPADAASDAEFGQYEGFRRLKWVLRAVKFTQKFTPAALAAMIHLSGTPLTQPDPEGEVVPAAVRRFQESDRPTFGGLEFCRIPAGEFTIGSKQDDKQAYDDEKPQHTLTLPLYYLARFSVTNRQFEQFITSTNYQTTAEEMGSAHTWQNDKWIEMKGAFWRKPRGPQSNLTDKADHPVVCVSWHDAQAYCGWLNEQYAQDLPDGMRFGLPSEPEWEKAARGEFARLYPWGNQPPDAALCNFNMNEKDTTPVGKYSPQGDSHYGCADLSGNVWEWTRSLFKPYPYQPADGREDLNAEAVRALRGGAFDLNPRLVRSAVRNRNRPFIRNDNIGFRVVVAPFISGL